MSIKIKKAEPKDYNRWDNYVKNHKESSVFHLTQWKNVIEQTFNHKSYYLIAEKNNKISGILPVFQIKSLLFGNFCVSIPFAETGGILADDEITERKLLKKGSETAQSKGADYLELRNRKKLPGLETKALYYNFRKEIYSDHDKNLKAIPRKSRAVVRKAMKLNLKSEIGHHLLDDFYYILSLNYHRLGTPIFPKNFFKNFLKEFNKNSDLLIVRTDKGEVAAAVLFFIYKDQMIPYYAGSDFSLRKLGPNDFMYWELMKYAVEKGCRSFDYGRSKEGTGSFSFKKHWGFKPEPLSYQYDLINIKTLPNLSPANPKYKKKIEAWQRMPYEITKLVGPFISKDLV